MRQIYSSSQQTFFEYALSPAVAVDVNFCITDIISVVELILLAEVETSVTFKSLCVYNTTKQSSIYYLASYTQ